MIHPSHIRHLMWTLILISTGAYAQTDALVIENNRVGVGTEIPTTALHVHRDDETAKVLVEETAPSPALREMFELRNNGGPFFIFKNTNRNESYSFAMLGNRFIISQQQATGVEFQLDPGGNATLKGTLTENSSRSAKEAIEPVEPGAVLDKVLALPLSEWSYKHDGPKIRHLGPMAEDFADAFGLGAGDRGISTLDSSGVALAAIQGLKAEQDAELAQRDAEIEALRMEVSQLRDLVQQLASGRPPAGHGRYFEGSVSCSSPGPSSGARIAMD